MWSDISLWFWFPKPHVPSGCLGLWDVQDVIMRSCHSHLCYGAGHRPKWVPAPPLASCVILGKFQVHHLLGKNDYTVMRGKWDSCAHKRSSLWPLWPAWPSPWQSRPIRLDSGCLVMGRWSICMVAKDSDCYLGAVASGKYSIWFCVIQAHPPSGPPAQSHCEALKHGLPSQEIWKLKVESIFLLARNQELEPWPLAQAETSPWAPVGPFLLPEQPGSCTSWSFRLWSETSITHWTGFCLVLKSCP